MLSHSVQRGVGPRASLRFVAQDCPRSSKIFLWVLLVLRRPDALSERDLLAHVGALFGISVILVAAEVIDLRVKICPHDEVSRTTRLGQRLGLELARPGRGGRG